MRLSLIALIFFLILTLGNALLMRSNDAFAHAHDYAYIQITQSHEVLYAWYAFLWREIIVLIVTAVLFGSIAATQHRHALRHRAHRSFDDRIANRR